MFFDIIGRNKYGNPRAYRLIAAPLVQNTVAKSVLLGSMADWSKYTFAVTKYKESELSSSSTYNQNLPNAPTVKFDDFLDGEDIEQKDIVVWVNVALHHLPRAEDCPNTLTTSSKGSILLTPFNMFNEDTSRDIKNSVLITNENGGAPVTISTYGVPAPTCKLFGYSGFDWVGKEQI